MTMPRETAFVRNLGTFLALFALLMMSGGLLALVAVVLPQALGLLLILVGFVFVATFHYVTWGWWLAVERAPAEDDDPFDRDAFDREIHERDDDLDRRFR